LSAMAVVQKTNADRPKTAVAIAADLNELIIFFQTR